MKIRRVTVERKAKADPNLGLILSKRTGSPQIAIKSISPNGLFCDTDLVPGLILLEINGSNVLHASIKDAVERFRIPSSNVTILVGGQVVQIEKECKNQKVGISLRKPRITNSGCSGIFIQQITNESLIEKGLKVGQRVTSINGTTCPSTAIKAIQMIQDTVGTLEVVVVDDPEEYRGMLATSKEKNSLSSVQNDDRVIATIIKSNPAEKLGLALRNDGGTMNNRRVFISQIYQNGLVARLKRDDKCPLQVGQVLLSINGEPCPPSAKLASSKLLSCADASVTIEASTARVTVQPLSKPKVSRPRQQVISIIHDKGIGNDIGVTFGMTTTYFFVQEIARNHSPFVETDLKEGQRLVSINDEIPSSLKDMYAKIWQASGTLKFVTTKEIALEGHTTNIVSPTSRKEGEKKEAINFEQDSRTDTLNEFPNAAIEQGWKELDATIFQKKESESCGLSLIQRDNHIFVDSISVESPFVSTRLRVGHRITKIDEEPCPTSLQDTEDLIYQHVGELTISVLEEVSKGRVHASMLKRNSNDGMPAGIKLVQSKHGRLIIARIDRESPFNDSPLRVGQVLESINGKECKDYQAFISLFDQAVGKVSLSASYFAATVHKPTIDSTVGISLRRVNEKDCIVVHSISEGGLLAGSPLLPGQRVVSIGGVKCPNNMVEAIGLIKDYVGELTILTVDPLEMKMQNSSDHIDVGLVMASANKATKESMMGITLRKGLQEGKVVISHISDKGPMAGKGFNVGQWIVSINNESCPTDPREATAKVKSLEGNVTIVASNSVATVRKPSRDSNVGISLSLYKKSDVAIYSIDANGLFGNQSELQAGQKVVSINGEKCPSTVAEAIRMIKDCEGDLTIVAVDIIYDIQR